MTKNVMYSMTTSTFSITMMTTRFPRMVQTIMKKIILIAFLLAWQNVVAAPAKTSTSISKPVARANKKVADKPSKTVNGDKTKPAIKMTAGEKTATKPTAKVLAEKKPTAKIEKSSHKNPVHLKTERRKIVTKNEKLTDKKTGKALVKTDQRGKSEVAPLSGHAKTRHIVLIKGKKYIGTPYLWGGTTPKGFDCSGLIHYLYRQEGVNIPRNSREQFSRLQATSNPQPGDLVFFRKKGVINHVGLYLGGGQMLHAPQTGMRVRIENIKRGKWPGRYAGARKAMKDKPITFLTSSKHKKAAPNTGGALAKNDKATRKAVDNKTKLTQRRAISANNKRLAKESKTIHNKGRVISAR